MRETEKFEWVADEYLEHVETGQVVHYTEWHRMREDEDYRIQKELESIQYYLQSFLFY